MVRVVDMDYSKEFCGGCHVKNTKEIKHFTILGIESKGSGIFRIEAATNNMIKDAIDKTLENIYKDIQALEARIDSYKEALKEEVKLNRPTYFESYEYILEVKDYANELKEIAKQLEKKVNQIAKSENALDINSFNKDFELINNVNVLMKEIKDSDLASVKDLADSLAEQKENSMILFALVNDGKIIFVCKNKVSSLNAGQIVKTAAIITGGNGGGRPDFAQAGGRDISKLEAAFAEVKKMVEGC